MPWIGKTSGTTEIYTDQELRVIWDDDLSTTGLSYPWATDVTSTGLLLGGAAFISSTLGGAAEFKLGVYNRLATSGASTLFYQTSGTGVLTLTTTPAGQWITISSQVLPTGRYTVGIITSGASSVETNASSINYYSSAHSTLDGLLRRPGSYSFPSDLTGTTGTTSVPSIWFKYVQQQEDQCKLGVYTENEGNSTAYTGWNLVLCTSYTFKVNNTVDVTGCRFYGATVTASSYFMGLIYKLGTSYATTTLVASTNVYNTSDTNIRWHDLVLPNNFNLASGTYIVGIMASGATTNARIRSEIGPANSTMTKVINAPVPPVDVQTGWSSGTAIPRVYWLISGYKTLNIWPVDTGAANLFNTMSIANWDKTDSVKKAYAGERSATTNQLDRRYIYTSGVGSTTNQLFTGANFTIPNGYAIHSLRNCMQAGQLGSVATLQIATQLRTGGVADNGVGFVPPSATYTAPFVTEYVNNPFTNSGWTAADISGSQFGLTVIASGSNANQPALFSTWLEVILYPSAAAQNLTPDPATVKTIVSDPTLSPQTILSPDQVIAKFISSDPVASPGSVTASPDLITIKLSISDPTLLPQTILTQDSFLVKLSSVDPSLSATATLTPDLITTKLLISDPAIVSQSVLTCDTPILKLSVTNPTATPGTATFTPDRPLLRPIISDPTVAPGQVTIAANRWNFGQLPETVWWFDADYTGYPYVSGNGVDTWRDLSGSGNNRELTQASARPVISIPDTSLGYNSVQRSGSNQTIRAADNNSLDFTRVSIFLLVKLTAINSGVSSAYRGVIDKNATFAAGGFGITEGDTSGKFQFWVNDYSTHYVQFDENEIRNWSLLSAIYDGTTIELWINGVSKGTHLYTSSIVANTDRLSVFGAFGNPVGSISVGAIQNRAISTSDRQKSEGFIAWNKGQQSLLPSTHPYKSIPPLLENITPALVLAMQQASLVPSVTLTCDTPIVKVRAQDPVIPTVSSSLIPDQPIVKTVFRDPVLVPGQVTFAAKRWTLQQLPETVLWFDADYTKFPYISGNKLTNWGDLSGSGNNKTTTSQALSPIIVIPDTSLTGHNSVYNYTHQIAVSHNASLNFTNVTLAMLVKITDSSSGFNRSLIEKGNFSSNGFGIVEDATDQFKFFINNYATNYVAFNESEILDWTLITARYDGSTIELWLNGVSKGTMAYTGSIVSTNIGLSIVTTDEPEAYLSTVAIQNRALSTSDRQKMEGFIAWDKDKQSLLPSGHPYKSIPPLLENITPSLVLQLQQATLVQQTFLSCDAPSIKTLITDPVLLSQTNLTPDQPAAKTLVSNPNLVPGQVVIAARPWTFRELPETVWWLDADYTGATYTSGGLVNVWNDLSGSGNHRVHTTLASQKPTYILPDLTISSGHNSVYASGTFGPQIRMQNNSSLNPSTISISLLVKMVSNASTNRGILDKGNWSNGGFGIVESDTTDTFEFFINDYINHKITFSESEILDWAIITATYDGSTMGLWINGVSKGTHAYASGIVSNTFDMYVLTTDEPKGYFSVGAIQKRALTTVERQKSEGFIAWDKGRVDLLPSNHPYKIAAPLAENITPNLTIIVGQTTLLASDTLTPDTPLAKIITQDPQISVGTLALNPAAPLIKLAVQPIEFAANTLLQPTQSLVKVIAQDVTLTAETILSLSIPVLKIIPEQTLLWDIIIPDNPVLKLVTNQSVLTGQSTTLIPELAILQLKAQDAFIGNLPQQFLQTDLPNIRITVPDVSSVGGQSTVSVDIPLLKLITQGELTGTTTLVPDLANIRILVSNPELAADGTVTPNIAALRLLPGDVSISIGLLTLQVDPFALIINVSDPELVGSGTVNLSVDPLRLKIVALNSIISRENSLEPDIPSLIAQIADSNILQDVYNQVPGGLYVDVTTFIQSALVTYFSTRGLSVTVKDRFPLVDEKIISPTICLESEISIPRRFELGTSTLDHELYFLVDIVCSSLKQKQKYSSVFMNFIHDLNGFRMESGKELEIKNIDYLGFAKISRQNSDFYNDTFRVRGHVFDLV